MGPGERMSVLRQNHSEYNDCAVIDTVMMGHIQLWNGNERKRPCIQKRIFRKKTGTAHLSWKSSLQIWTAGMPKAMRQSLLSGLGIKEESHQLSW
jgi:ABC-type cobalamin/Fe3+-siderophores transport system ATPase subunit